MPIQDGRSLAGIREQCRCYGSWLKVSSNSRSRLRSRKSDGTLLAMRQLQPVLWTKGLVLAPQHLQMQDRYFEDQLGFQLASLTRWPWGFSRLRLDDGALAAGTFKILEAAGAFPDGMVFDVPQSDSTIPPRTVAEVWTADEATRRAKRT